MAPRRVDYTRTGLYQALKTLREQGKITPDSFPKTVYTFLEQIDGQPDRTFQKFRPWYYRIKDDLFNGTGEEKGEAASNGGKTFWFFTDVSEDIALTICL